jgi:hypothetical protein
MLSDERLVINELLDEIIRLRSELARFREGMPTAEEFASVNISVGGGETKARKVADWISMMADAGGISE